VSDPVEEAEAEEGQPLPPVEILMADGSPMPPPIID
jgi:hypothetical protein